MAVATSSFAAIRASCRLLNQKGVGLKPLHAMLIEFVTRCCALPAVGEILLYVDDGSSAELNPALADAEPQGDDELVSWAREPSPP
jgi:hypothetical protein